MIRQLAALIGLIGLTLTATPALAAKCDITIDSTDQMRFDTEAVQISKSCKEFTVKLTHSGKLPKTAMGHNWVLTTAADMQGVVTDGMNAGAGNDYLKPKDPRVIANTKLIGGGESDSVTFPVTKLKSGQEYMFFCSFPGHSSLMKGKVALVD